MEATVNDGALPPLTEKTVNYIIAIDEDTEEDRLRIQQMQDIDNDMQSIIDEQIAAQERWEEENEDPQARFAMEQLTWSIHEQWNEEARHAEARERYERRQEQDRPRHEGTESALQERYQALHQMVITERRSRLEAAQRAVHGNTQDAERPPKAPLAGIQVPASRTPLPQPTLTTQQLREKVQHEEERQRLNAGGHYVSPSAPNHQQDKERLAKLEAEEGRQQLRALSEREAEDERQRLQAYAKRLEEELQEHAAQQGVPEERIAQVQEVQVAVPEISALPAAELVNGSTSGSTSGQTSSTSSNTRRRQQVEDSDEHYFENIFEYMSNYWLEENGINTADELHEGVLYWMKLDDIKDLLKRSQRGEPEAAKRVEKFKTITLTWTS
eukprot:939926-Amphidinium_carterae.1